eukprot:TRINITY_DN8065_c0_g1_i1.p1 TRINITY_DN8065_c0_g1~~TRINITY_DN8065_c0_g1_i1.p1  ORF type:complete len:163 (-),score=43.53 TRINITY_DN8065_c0_g1_i1:36-524(-)
MIPTQETTEEWSPNNKTLSMTLRKSIRDNQEKWNQYLSNINTALGGTYTLAFQGLPPQKVDELSEEGYKGRIGEVVTSYLESVSQMIERKAKDDMTKESAAEAISNKKVVLRYLEKRPSDGFKADSYWDITIEDGNLVVSIAMDAYWSNVSYIVGYNLDKIL